MGDVKQIRYIVLLEYFSDYNRIPFEMLLRKWEEIFVDFFDI